MKRFKYLSSSLLIIIILPLVYNYFTNSVSFDVIWNNQLLIYLIISVLMNIIFLVSFVFYRISDSDKMLVDEIINKLNIQLLYKMTNNIESFLPIDFSNINHIYDFIKYYEINSIKLSNKGLKKLFDKFIVDLKILYELLNNSNDHFKKINQTNTQKHDANSVNDLSLKELNTVSKKVNKKLKNLIQYI